MDTNDICKKCTSLSLTEEDGLMVEIGVDWQTSRVQKLLLNLYALDRNKVMEGGPWSFDKHLMALQEVVDMERVSKINFRDVWVYLGGMIGGVKEIDAGDYGDCKGKFIRVRVLVDVLVPLKRGLRVDLAESPVVCSVLICYERLTNFCYLYGLIGYLVEEYPGNSGVKWHGDRMGSGKDCVDMGNASVNVEVEYNIVHDSVNLMKPSRKWRLARVQNEENITEGVLRLGQRMVIVELLSRMLGINSIDVLRDSLGKLAVNLGAWNREKKRACNEELNLLHEDLQYLYGGAMNKTVGTRIKMIEGKMDRILEKE
ncbi:hypothetical protein EZV62_015640 [Acer yangbiense]|uniref:DUF4283 domain-containing protein n=1 Tax=Acer yangbiense TaxID=1000413 RepID=A0A5C7HLE2_9ROSI|nr:hypothetical protein EZV62_015640 [Acer yangbiense]